MPTYDYRCKRLRRESFEIQHSRSPTTPDGVPDCTGALKKVFSADGISFKGSGFYKTRQLARFGPVPRPQRRSSRLDSGSLGFGAQRRRLERRKPAPVTSIGQAGRLRGEAAGSGL